MEVGIIILLKVVHLPKKQQLPTSNDPKKTVTPNWEQSRCLALRQIRGIHRIQLRLPLGIRSAATAAGRRGLIGPSLESFNGSRVHLLTVIFLRGVSFLPASGPPKITWFKVGKKNQIAKNQTKVWGVF